MNTELINYTLHLADNALIAGHRCSEWCGHGPVLEQDIAISNIALDFIGQARNLYQHAAALINEKDTAAGATEDSLAYLREEHEFKNVLITEVPNGDWAQTILRQFFFSAYQFYFYLELKKSNDQQLAAIAEKSLKEVTYHLRWSSEWVIRLGDGTEESKRRMEKAIEALWMFTGEMLVMSDYETEVVKPGVGVDLTAIKPLWEKKVQDIFDEANLTVPQTKTWHQSGGKEGIHTEHLGYILAEMQYLQRVHPGATW